MIVRVGDSAPSFRARAFVPGTTEPAELSLDELAGSWLVLVFYRGDFTLLAPIELQALAELAPAFAEAGARIVAVSTDSAWSHKAWLESHPLLAGVRFPVVADTTHAI